MKRILIALTIPVTAVLSVCAHASNSAWMQVAEIDGKRYYLRHANKPGAYDADATGVLWQALILGKDERKYAVLLITRATCADGIGTIGMWPGLVTALESKVKPEIFYWDSESTTPAGRIGNMLCRQMPPDGTAVADV